MSLLGYFGALIMGLILGLIGGGGSILTVPLLVYLFHIDTVLATAYSLFIVGTTALFGGISHMRSGNVNWHAAQRFGIPSVITVFATRKWLVPALPEVWFQMGTMTITRDIGLLILFALLMLAAALTMISKRRLTGKGSVPMDGVMGGEHPADLATGTAGSGPIRSLIYPEALALGLLAGLVGAGGGFLIVPFLVFFSRLGMKQAIGTSLVIIAINSLIGFTGDLIHGRSMDWAFLLAFTSLAIVGILLGSAWSKRVHSERLRPAFGWFVLVVGIGIIIKELAGA